LAKSEGRALHPALFGLVDKIKRHLFVEKSKWRFIFATITKNRLFIAIDENAVYLNGIYSSSVVAGAAF